MDKRGATPLTTRVDESTWIPLPSKMCTQFTDNMGWQSGDIWRIPSTVLTTLSVQEPPLGQYFISRIQYDANQSDLFANKSRLLVEHRRQTDGLYWSPLFLIINIQIS